MDSEQTQADRLLNFLGWVEVNKKRLLTIGVTAAALVVAVIAFVQYQAQKETRASVALSNVLVPINPSQPIPPGTDEKYLAVAKEHSGTMAAARALLQAASTRFVDGKYDGALSLFNDFIKQYPDSPFIAQAHYGVGACYEALGKMADAQAKYEEVRKRYATDPVIDDTKLALARTYEAQNKNAEAYKLYEEVTESGRFGGLGEEAQVRMEQLLEKHPEVRPTNAMPENPMVPPMMMMTNRPAGTNRPASLTNVVRTITNAAAAAARPALTNLSARQPAAAPAAKSK